MSAERYNMYKNDNHVHATYNFILFIFFFNIVDDKINREEENDEMSPRWIVIKKKKK